MIFDILRDDRGFMWFGSQHGLNRWDGRSMRAFYHIPLDSTSLPGSEVRALAQTADGLIWVGTGDGGLGALDPRTESFTSYLFQADDTTSLIDNAITALQVDFDDQLWIGTQKGLCRLDRNSKTFIRYRPHPHLDNSLPSNSISAMGIDASGQLWIGMQHGWLSRYDPQSNSFVTIQHALLRPTKDGTNRITGIASDPQGEFLWLSVFPLGVIQYSLRTGEATLFGARNNDTRMINKNAVFDIARDKAGLLWVASLRGVTQLNPRTGAYQLFEPDDADPYSIYGEVLNCVYVDPQNIVWTGSNGWGVDVYNPYQIRFEHYKSKQIYGGTLIGRSVWGLDRDKHGYLWLSAIPGGIQRVNLQSGDTRSFQTDDSDPAVWSMTYSTKVLVDRQDRVWMGTIGAGLRRWDMQQEQMKLYRKISKGESLLSNNTIYALLETRDGTIWVGTDGGGIHRYRPETDDFEFIHHNPSDPHSLASDHILTLFEDARGDLWVGTADAGLDCLDRISGKFNHYPADNHAGSINSNTVMALYEDPFSRLWVGTRGGGLLRLDSERKHFEQIDLGIDPAELEVDAILEDGHGFLWISSNRGILKIHPESGLVARYLESDGVQGPEFVWESRLKDSEGFLYFGGSRGLNRFHPDSIHINEHIPPVYFTDLWIDHERIRPGEFGDGQPILPRAISYLDTVYLSYHHKVLRFDFIALDFWNPQLNQYRCMLKNFDPDWVELGSTNSITYTSLDPGWYTLRVQGSNNDRIWNNSGAQLILYIKPPFWETLLFKSAIALLVLVLFFVVMWFRSRRLRAQNQKLEALVRQRTEELKIEMESSARAKQEHLRRELITKTLHLNENQQIVEHLQLDLEDLAQTIPAESRSRLSKILRFLKDHVSVQKGWEDFELWFTEVHTTFYSSLREVCPVLSESELKVCALLRLNLVSKDIARVMNIQPASINIYRHRIRKKLNLESEDTLSSFLSQF